MINTLTNRRKEYYRANHHKKKHGQVEKIIWCKFVFQKIWPNELTATALTHSVYIVCFFTERNLYELQIICLFCSIHSFQQKTLRVKVAWSYEMFVPFFMSFGQFYLSAYLLYSLVSRKHRANIKSNAPFAYTTYNF